jgi:Rad3-related DNA helicase
MQAAGRVIRTRTDKGIVVLVDERFVRPEYQELFPAEWHAGSIIETQQDLKSCLGQFWNPLPKNNQESGK